jgi:hypothetical protein
MTDCYYEKKDWRACKKEVSRGHVPHTVFGRKVPDGIEWLGQQVLMVYVDGDVPRMLEKARQ